MQIVFVFVVGGLVSSHSVAGPNTKTFTPHCDNNTDVKTFGVGGFQLGPGVTMKVNNATFVCSDKSGQFQVQTTLGAVVWNDTEKTDPRCGNKGSKCEVCFQGDGNLVNHGFAGQPLWAADTWNAYGEDVKELSLQPHPPFARIFNTACQIMWWSNPEMPPPGPVNVAKFPVSRAPGLTLLLGQSIDIKNVSLVFTYGGNIQINDTTVTPATVLWSTKTHCIGNCSLDLQNDGNFVLHHWKGTLHNSSVQTVWATWTYGQNEGVLVLQNKQPYLYFDSAHGQLLWSSMGLANFTHSNLGGVYYDSESPAITVGNLPSNTPVTWEVYDYDFNHVENGTLMADASGVVVVAPNVSTRGYYDVVIAGSFNTSFVIVADNTLNFKLGYASRFGVGTHFSQKVSADMMPLIKKLGTSNIRDDAGAWSGVEKVKGVYNFSDNAAWMTQAHTLGLTPTCILAFSNPLYTWGPGDRIGPYNQTGYDAYANYCGASIKNYPWVKSWEIWNEYIGSFVEGPAKSNISYYYTQMIKVAAKKIRAVATSDVMIAGGAAEDIPLPTFELMFEDGLLEDCDALVIHPYGYKEGIEHKLARLDTMMKNKSKTNSALPVFATEWSDQEVDTFQGRRAEANYAVRLSALMLAGGTARFHYFLMSDFQSWTRGMVREEKSKWGKFAATPAFAAYSTAISMLGGATTFVGRGTPITSNSYVLHFRNANKDIRLCWAAGENATIKLTANVGALSAFNMIGAPVQPPVLNEPWMLPSDPVYIIGEVTISDLQPVPIADSYIQFSYTQGQDNWQYGYFPIASTTFSTATISFDEWVYFWVGPEPFCRVYDIGGVPGSTHSSVRRWTSNITSAVLVSGWIQKPNGNGASVSGCIYHNGDLLHNYTAAPDQQLFYNTTLTVKSGDKLDFALSGDGANVTYPVDDHTSFRVQIYTM